MKWIRFSQRIGKKPIKDILQLESIDDDLKNHLWNTIIDIFKIDDNRGYNHNVLSNYIWATFYKQTKDQIPNNGYYNWFRDWFFTQAEWCEVYDFIEYLCVLYYDYNNGYSFGHRNSLYDYIDHHIDIYAVFNNVLEEELAGYRIIDGRITPITDKIELQSINDAIENSNQWKSVSTHLKKSIEYLSDKKNPEYRNCIKESISAVEAFCKIITNKEKATLGETLKEIEKKYTIHSALKDAFGKIYGYTSDADGIRHSLTEKDSIVNQEDAIFMLVSCSAFINYLKSKIK
jgi:hypothetical protein